MKFMMKIKARKKFNIIFSLAVCFFLLSMSTCRVVKKSCEEAKKDALDQIGLYITLNSPVDEAVEQEVLNKITYTSNVVGINQSVSIYVMPKNFENVKKYIGSNPYKQEIQLLSDTNVTKDSVVIEGNMNIQFNNSFLHGCARLTEGAWPSNSNPGAIISEELRRKNGLKIGDVITFRYDDIQSSVRVVGIYTSTDYFQICEENPIGENIFASSPYNRIYVDSNTACNIIKRNYLSSTTNIYVSTYDDLVKVGTTLKQTLALNWSKFTLINETEQQYRSQAYNVYKAIAYSEAFYKYITFIGIVIFLLIGFEISPEDILPLEYTHFSRTKKYFGLLFTLLKNTIIAFLISMIFVAFLKNDIISFLNEYDPFPYYLQYSYITGNEFHTQFYYVPFSISEIVSLLWYAVVLDLSSSLFPAYSLLKSK